MKRYLIVILLTYSSLLVSFPINYQRFILTDKSGKSIKKVVDLFGDNHRGLNHPKSGFDPENASNINYTQVERTLNDILTKLELFADKHPVITRRGEKERIDLIWEMAAKQTGNSSSVFMHAIGAKLAQEFSPNKNKFIRFIFADEYRGIDMALFAVVYGHHDRTVSVSTTYDNYPVSFLVGDIIDPIKKQGPIDLAQVQDSLTPQFYNPLLTIWHNYVKELDTFIIDYSNDSRMLIELAQDNQFFERFFNLFALLTANIEMLIKILNTKNIRTIVYAGEAHSKWIGQELEKLGFKKIVDIGIKDVADIDRNISVLKFVHLNQNAIKFLLKVPTIDQPKVESTLTLNVIKNLNDLFANFNTMTEPQFMAEMNEILAGFNKAYIDIGNLQMGFGKVDNPTLLHIATLKKFDKAVERLLQLPGISVDMATTIGTPLGIAVVKYTEGNNEIDKAKSRHIIDLLLSKKANVNIPDKNGNTPLLLAAAFDIPELVQLLLEHGANPNIANLEGKTPIDVTDWQDLADLLVRYGAKEEEPIVPIVEEITTEKSGQMPQLVD